ncbi:DUF2092 domain-containing protein [Rhizobium sp. LjRoot254]|uniref:DUF2092 domain-containing protein n=1 Tax=Rhizobium sp. LjRoot254 TaxID=3342297 RepID=UPI003ED02CA2
MLQILEILASKPRLRTASLSTMAGAAFALAAMAPTLAQDAASSPPETEADVLVQQEAVKALDTMAAYLRTLKQFKLTATTTSEDVLEDGQKIEILGQTTFLVRTPDRMKVSIDNDKHQREYYYDGKSVTQVSPALGYYAVFDAPDTIAKTIITAEEKYGVRLPLADLFFWNSAFDRNVEIKSAYFAGQSRILGERCDHYAFRVAAADVQIWIRANGDPLPCRMVITEIDSAERPQQTATLDWDTDAEIDDSNFLYAAPPEMGLIDQDPVDSTGK